MNTLSKGSNVRIAKLLAASALMAATFGLISAPASAQEEAKIRVGHFSPDAPAVDIYVDGRKTFAQVRFPLMSAYTPVAAGKHTIDVRAAGSPASDPALISVAADMAAGKPYLVAALGPAAALQGALIEDDITPPAANKAKVRVIHAAVGGPPVDVVVAGSTKLFEGVQFGKAAPYSEVDATKYDLSVRPTGKTDQLVGKVVSLQTGGVYTIVAVGDAAGTIGLRGFADLAPSGVSTNPASDPTSDDSAAAGATEAAGTASTTTKAGATDTAPTTEASTEATEATTEETTAAATEAATTEAAATEAAPSSEPVPAGGVDSGFGGMSNSQSAVSVFVLAAFVGSFGLLAARRRRAA